VSLRLAIYDEASLLAQDMLLGNDRVLDLLLARGLSAETIMDYRLGYVPKNFSLARSLVGTQSGRFPITALKTAGLIIGNGNDYLSESLVIPYFSHGQVITLRERAMADTPGRGKYRWLPGGVNVRFWNRDDLLQADEVIITEGELDAAVLRQCLQLSPDVKLRNYGVIALPGCQSWPEDMESDLQHLKKIYVALDPDVEGKKAAIKLHKTLGTRVRVVELPQTSPKCDWTEYLRSAGSEHPHGGHSWTDVSELLQTAELHGKRVYSIGDAQAKWKRWQREMPGLKTGFNALDIIINPGIKPGQVVVPIANTGTGKSMFLLNLLHNMRGVSQLVVSCELTTPELFERLRRVHFFWNEAAPESQILDDYALVGINDENRISDLPQVLEEYREIHGFYPRVLHVDYLQYYARSSPGSSEYERTTNAIMELKAIAKEFELSVITPSQVNRLAEQGRRVEMDKARGSGAVEETADFAFGLYKPEMGRIASDGTVESNGAVKLSILKSRHGGTGKEIHLQTSNMSLVIVDALDRRSVIRIEQENTDVRRAVSYEDYRAGKAPAPQAGLFAV